MFDSLLEALGHSWWAYPLILASCTFDAILPLLPSETALLTGGILAANGSMLLGWVIVMAAVGAFVGDNLAYAIGHSADDWARRWITRGEKGKRSLDWAHRELDRHGGPLVIVARFLPGGRTATTIACGVLDFPYRQFVVFDAIGAVVWATLNTLIGYIGGNAFAHNTIAAFAVSFAAALGLAGIIELIRWIRRRARRQRQAQR
ncbi:DedA family protein [Mycobacterium sp.]|uniref:DedA family protein n=1 Tax=Mycobacterium sp. TaxID=1785 RepID=UPI00262E1EE6|nr:DedA family protein [Mycobacterium sp.]